MSPMITLVRPAARGGVKAALQAAGKPRSQMGSIINVRSFMRSQALLNDSSRPRQSFSPIGPLGIEAALEAASNPTFTPRPNIFDEFALKDRVALVSGANRGIGLEMAIALAEAGARAVYCLDMPSQPGEEWVTSRDFVKRLGNGSRLEYISADVRNQKEMWQIGQDIGDREGRMDVCVANAGIHRNHIDCLEYPEEEFNEVMEVNTNGVLFTAQAGGRQMARFGTPGSIVLIASMSGSVTNKDHAWVSYNTSKSAVLQMARSMACELGARKIRVNSISPGYITTRMTNRSIDANPHLLDKWSAMKPLGRLGRPDELRGVVTWLASDASSFCTGSDIIVDGGYTAW
ncbi:hypothetical protein HYDPIDRAFT_106123 [Hydnomerulius pinastri MD-312]|nr:hypothetical protein HYDPIDRAFT_106123 [Hydnomerulius pinastri MD-312]